MLDYIIILIAALIAFPFAFLLIKKGRIPRSSLLIIASGLVVALIGIFIGQNYPFYYTAFLMLALALALSLLLDKQFAKSNVVEVPQKISDQREPRSESEVQQYIQSEVAATVEVEDTVMGNSVEDDLESWMSADQETITVLEEEELRRGK